MTKQRVEIDCYMPVGRNRIISTRGWKKCLFRGGYQVRKTSITNLSSDFFKWNSVICPRKKRINQKWALHEQIVRSAWLRVFFQFGIWVPISVNIFSFLKLDYSIQNWIDKENYPFYTQTFKVNSLNFERDYIYIMIYYKYCLQLMNFKSI